jgi:hypothetical protein
MVKQPDVQMPEDWNNHAGWDEYYEYRLTQPSGNGIGSIPIEDLPGVAANIRSKGGRAVWIPGCGLSPLARLLAHLGLDVVATDVSPVAVQFQREQTDAFSHLTGRLGPVDPAGSLVAELHDFRSKFRRDAFDLIINVKAIQGFGLPDVRGIARNHALALRKGGVGIFDTLNVQGEHRDDLERSLEDGGFIVPLAKLDRWYRAALRESGLPHIFVLGQPMIPRTGEYAEDESAWERDMARLRAIGADYQARLLTEQESERLRIGPDGKVAHVIYSTG